MNTPFYNLSRLLMQAVSKQMGVMEGKQGELYFSHNVELLEKKTFQLAGKLVRWSITQGGPGLPVLDTTLFDLMFEKHSSPTLSYECVRDIEVYEKLHEVSKNDEISHFLKVHNYFAISILISQFTCTCGSRRTHLWPKEFITKCDATNLLYCLFNHKKNARSEQSRLSLVR